MKISRIITSILCLSASSAMLAGQINQREFNSYNVDNISRLAETENIIYSEDFEGETLDGFNGALDLVDGKGVFNGSTISFDVPIDESKLVESNNYEVSFDIIYNSQQESYFHLVGLDGNGPDRNIYLGLVANGQFLKIADFDGYDIYDNSGDDQGSRAQDFQAKLNTTGVNFKFVILDDVVEFYAEGVRRIAVPLKAFGNNRYNQGRHEIVKGIIKGFMFDARCAKGELILDNFLVKEAKRGTTKFTTNERITQTNYDLPLNYNNLYRDNFYASATFEVNKDLVTTEGLKAFPKLQLLMNQIVAPRAPDGGNPTNFINAQAELDREFQNGWLGGLKTDYNWGSVNLPTTQASFEGDTIFTIETHVYDENIRFAIRTNGTNEENNYKVIDTTFAELGFKKGELLGVRVNNEYTTCTNATYIGFENSKGVDVITQKSETVIGKSVKAKAYILADTPTENMVWYVDGEPTTISNTEHEFSFDTEGKHTIAYGNESFMSTAQEINVSSQILTLEASKTEVYTGETVEFTLTKAAESENAVEWYVNDVKQEATGDTFTFSGFEFGTDYKICAKLDGVVSNIIDITVLESEIKIEAEKGSYLNTEKATVTANFLGVNADNVEWYINDAKVEGENGQTLTIDLSKYEKGSLINVQAASGDLKSNILPITIAYDVKTAISENEFYKNVYEKNITNDSDATFGGFDLVKGETDSDAYYKPKNQGNDAQFDAFNVMSSKWMMEYDLLIPENITGDMFVYPQMAGMDTKFPTDQVELAVGIHKDKIDTYIKFHNRGLSLEESTYGTGADLSYEGGIVKKGDWNHITVAIDSTYIAFYVNDVMTFFADVPNTTVPSTGTMSMFFADGYKNENIGFKNFKINAIVEPAPDVSSVSLSASKISAKVGETVTLTASLTPFNSEAKTIEWYVNDTKVECDQLRYELKPTEAGTYKVVCKVNGVASEVKEITFTAGEEKPSEDETTNSNTGLIVGLSIGGVALVAIIAAVVYFLVIKKRK